MERLGVQKHECIVFEDSPTGVTSGAASGAVVVGVSFSILSATRSLQAILQA